MAARTAQLPASDALTLADAATQAPARKPLPYTITSATAPVAGGGVVGLGKNAKTDAQVVIFQEGRMQQAMSINALAAAIYHGVIPAAEITELLEKAKADKTQ